MDTLSEETTLSSCFYLPAEKGSTLKGKMQIFPYRVDLFSEGTWYAVKQTESHKSYNPCKQNGIKSTNLPSPFNNLCPVVQN